MQKHSTIRNGQRLVWYTPRLWELAANLPSFEMEIEAIRELDQDCWFDGKVPTLREIALHAERIEDADLSFPIILNDDGSLMDGGHRICKALNLGHTTILAVKFATMPEPDAVLRV